MMRRYCPWGRCRWLSLPARCTRGFSMPQLNYNTHNPPHPSSIVLYMSKQAGNRNGTQVIQPKQQRKPKEKQEKTEEKLEQTMPKKGGVRIGGSKEQPDQWRCKTCHRPNPMSVEQCQICQDPKSLSVPPKKEQ